MRDKKCLYPRSKLAYLKFLRPVIRAYGLSYASTAGPQIFRAVVSARKKNLSLNAVLASIQRVLFDTCQVYDFPFFCSALIAGYKLLQISLSVVFRLLSRYLQHYKRRHRRASAIAAVRFAAAFTSAWFSLNLLNRPKKIPPQKPAESGNPERPAKQDDVSKGVLEVPRRTLGKSMDLTLFAVSRALETIIHRFWTRRKLLRIQQKRWTRWEQFVSHYADASLFATSAGVVMWAWFYLPDRLPRAYNQWIKSAAQVDHRLIEALRRARDGKLVYGEDNGQAHLLQEMCADYVWPLDWGNPAKVIPFPCEMVHMGVGPSCHWHALVRFAKAFKFALAMYLPLQIVLRASHPSLPNVRKAVREAVRSSTFLGAFVSLFYYGVCLARTRLGPKIFSKNTVTPLMWDSGLCVRAGCLLCGWSILLEAEKRRQELAMFVVPRAAATFFPRRYSEKHFWRERLAFSLSTATLFTMAHHDAAHVRGVLGGVLHGILA